MAPWPVPVSDAVKIPGDAWAPATELDRGVLAAMSRIVRQRDLVSSRRHDGSLAGSGFGCRENTRRRLGAGDRDRRTSRAIVQWGDLHLGRASDLPRHLCVDLRG